MGPKTTIDLLFGTVTGNSEMVADDLALFFIGSGYDVRVRDMRSFDPRDVDRDALHVFVCSTHGDGDVPWPAYPFVRSIRDRAIIVHGLRYAVFGLGDSDYIYSYGQGSETLDDVLSTSGALRVGEHGRHDAATGDDPGTTAVEWASRLVGEAAFPRT